MINETNKQELDARLLADFIQWSGGFHPSECEDSEIVKYAHTSASVEIGKHEAIRILNELAGR